MENRMLQSQDSLFSLELVVEKLYIPYATCRFPAVAFRLLDFPTILISHVESQLSDVIKRKIKADPYYHLPNQFADLQDKHGNFMVKKGKSCLFKIPVDTLAMHLTNTPLYIMVIDEYPEVPKLLGNSSLALNEVMDSIVKDMNKNGPSVPSVQGDKGLFKVYSLMGKEIGYVIMGFRLISLGPGLISHLPNSAFVTRTSDKKQNIKEVQPCNIVEEIIEVREQQSMHAAPPSVRLKQMPIEKEKRKDKLNDTREMASMTDAETCDALMQTVEFGEKKVHVAVSEKLMKTIETQTEKRKRQIPKDGKEFKFVKEESGSDDEVIINPNIVCPPPLFYNSKAEPNIEIERDVNPYLGYSSTFDEITLEDFSGDEFETLKKDQIETRAGVRAVPSDKVKDEHVLNDVGTVVISRGSKAQGSPHTIDPTSNLQGLTSSDAMFPLLTALLTELSKIQNPQLVSEAMQHVSKVKKLGPDAAQLSTKIKSKPSTVRGKVDETTESNADRKRPKRSTKPSTQAADAVSKKKGWIRKAPEVGVKKTKLTFGLTNTQRLRLAKQNPTWLESAEQDEKASKLQKQKLKQNVAEPDHDTGNLSDTFTEVRRLAAKELEKSTLGKSQLVNDETRRIKLLKKKAPKSRDNSPAKKASPYKSKSPKSRKTKSLKATVNVREDSDSLQDTGADFAIDLDPDRNDLESPDMTKGEKLDSAADSIPSSRIEVHIPSARAYESDENDNTFSNSYDENIGSDRRDTRSKFPGFSKGDDTLPESIAGEGNQSFNNTIDEDSPLESTRVSKQFKGERQTGESLFKSAEDYDTKQFQSTDEPELQKLISEDERTETQPTPVTDRSPTTVTDRSPSPALTPPITNTRLSMKFEVLNPKASQQSPLPALRRSQQMKVDSMNARPSPTNTPRSRTSPGSPKQPTPRPRKPLRDRKIEFRKESIHTESVSSYMPSESENILSLISDGSYSDDFHMSSEKDDSSRMSVTDLPKLIPSTKLGFTIG